MARSACATWGRGRAAVLLLAFASGCATGGGGDTVQRRDGSSGDAGRADAGGRLDASATVDASHDAGATTTDAAVGPVDAGTGVRDAGADAGPAPTDAGPPRPCAPTSATLAITEVMIASISGSGDRGEWFEVVSTATCAMDLTGLVIESVAGVGAPVMHTVTSATIPAGDHFVFAMSAVAAENHGLAHDYVYGSTISFANGGGTLRLRVGATVVDEVSWPSGGFTYASARQFPAGAALDTNGTWAFWCDATNVYSSMGGTFLGTPGMANGLCP